MGGVGGAAVVLWCLTYGLDVRMGPGTDYIIRIWTRGCLSIPYLELLNAAFNLDNKLQFLQT